MRKEEYSLIRRVEDFHWWYGALRGVLTDAWMRFGPPSGGSVRICDAGCGTGGVLAMLKRNGQAFGIDIAPEALHFSQDRRLSRLVRGSIQEMPFRAAVFDAVVSLDVLYHRSVPDRGAAVREMVRLLKPGGVLFVNVPAYEWLRSPHDAAVHTGHRFTRNELCALLEANGAEVIWASYWNALLLPVIAAARWVRRASGERSDLEGARDSWINRLLLRVLRAERALLRHCGLPFGVSIFAVAKKRPAWSER